MIISYFYFSAFLAGIYLLFIYKNRFKFGFVLPSTVFMLMWTIACISSIVVQKNKDLNEFSMSYDRVGIYMFFFIISSFLGFILARFFTVRRKGPVNINLLWAKYLSSKLQIFLYLSFLLGLLRIFIIVRTFGFESLYDYRQNVFLIEETM